MWSFARIELNLDNNDFWALTLKEFSALKIRKELVDEKEEFGYGQICAILANVNKDAKTPAFSPSDFMPSRLGREQREEPTEQAVQREFRQLKARVNKLNEGK